jgi:hypothetical protein
MNKIIVFAFACWCTIGCGKKRDEYQQPQDTTHLVVEAESKAAPIVIAKKFPVDSISGDFPLDSLLEFSSEEALQKAFGENVKRSIGYMPEGTGQYPNTILFPGTEREVEFIWNDTLNFSQIHSIHISREGSPWKTLEGITIGTTLKELEKLNGKAFIFSGFGWDYAGGVNWDHGDMAPRQVLVSLELPADIISNEFEPLMGDHDIISDSDLAQKANPVVAAIVLRKEE